MTDAHEVQAMIQHLSEWAASQPAAPNDWRLGILIEGANQAAEARSAYECALQLDPHFLPARTALDDLQAVQR